MHGPGGGGCWHFSFPSSSRVNCTFSQACSSYSKSWRGSLLSPQLSPLSFAPRALCSSPTSTSSLKKPDTSPPQALRTHCSVWNCLLPESALLLHFLTSLIKYPPSANNARILPSLFPLCFVFLHSPYHSLTFCTFICLLSISAARMSASRGGALFYSLLFPRDLEKSARYTSVRYLVSAGTSSHPERFL